MAFYTNVDQYGNRIFHRYVDDNGNSKSEIVKNFPFQLFVKSGSHNKTKSNMVSLMGDLLIPVDFDNISDAREFVKEYQETQDIFGQTQFLYQFIATKYKENISFDFSKIKILIIDIETAYDSTGFPTPDKAQQSILAIGCKVLGEKNPFIVFGTKANTTNNYYTYIQCNNEEHLLKSFQAYWKEVNPNIVTGWNVEGFDIPYIINRCNRVMGEDFTKKFCPFHGSIDKCIIPHENKIQKINSYEIVGISIVDYLPLYKKYSTVTLESYRLDVVAQHELGIGKVDYSEYDGLMGLYEQNFELFCYYNYVDVKIIEDLENKLNFLFLLATVTYLGKSNYLDSIGVVRWWDVYIYNELLKKGIQIPPGKKPSSDEGIVGAFVKDPIPKLYSWIVTLDLTSLYPSIIMSFNLSPEKAYKTAIYDLNKIDNLIDMNEDLSWIKESNVTILANGATFKRDNQGILPELVAGMFDSRKMFKKHMLKATAELEEMKKSGADPATLSEKISEVATFSAKQQAYKISLNSLYGATANPYFRYNSRDISEGITMTGQLVIRFISKRLNVHLNNLFKTQDVDYVIFNDTDSAGLNFEYFVNKMFDDQTDKQKIVNFLDKFVQTYINPFLVKEFQKLTDYLNAFENRLSMNREVIADKGLWRGKKNYILQMYDKEGIRYTTPKMKIMGLETAKSSTPNIARESLEAAIKILLNDNEEKLQQFVKDFKCKFFSSSVQDIAFPRGVNDINKWISSNGTMLKGIPIHTRGSVVYNRLLKTIDSAEYAPIKNGDKIKFVYLKAPNSAQSHVIAFLDTLPPAFNLDKDIDKETQFNKTFLEPLKSLASIVGWNTEKTNSLDMFFQ